MILLLDANVLIALTNRSHIHHERARQWFGNKERMFATCPVTQGALVRHYFRDAEQPQSNGVFQLLRQIESMVGHVFWQDMLVYSKISLVGVIGHRQLTLF
jgi:predicted nucleic acid-binding protein